MTALLICAGVVGLTWFMFFRGGDLAPFPRNIRGVARFSVTDDEKLRELAERFGAALKGVERVWGCASTYRRPSWCVYLNRADKPHKFDAFVVVFSRASKTKKKNSECEMELRGAWPWPLGIPRRRRCLELLPMLDRVLRQVPGVTAVQWSNDRLTWHPSPTDVASADV